MTKTRAAGEPPELDSYRSLADELLDDGEPVKAEAVLEQAPGDVILEVGGGTGLVGTFALLAEPSATLVSHEANPALMATAARTQELNGVSFVMRNAMLGAKAGTANFFVNRAFWASSATHDYGGGTVIEVPVEPVADVLAERPCNFVVMDIEGSEIDLVPRMDLSGVDRFVLETHPNITGARTVRRLLRRLRSDFDLRSEREVGGVHLLVCRP